MSELSKRSLDVLAQARAAMAPTAADRDRVRGALDVKLAAMAASAAGGALAGKGSLSGAGVATAASGTAKLVLVLVVSAAVGGTGTHYGLKAMAPPQAAVRPDVVAVAPQVVLPPVPRAPEAVTAVVPAPSRTAPARLRAQAPVAPLELAPSEAASVEAANAPVPSTVLAPGAPGAAATPDVPQPAAIAHSEWRAVPCTVSDELTSLRPAQKALSAQAPEQALALIEPYFQSCRGGALEPEAHAARALALCQLGRAAEAQDDLEWLKAKGALRPSLKKVCAELPRLKR